MTNQPTLFYVSLINTQVKLLASALVSMLKENGHAPIDLDSKDGAYNMEYNYILINTDSKTYICANNTDLYGKEKIPVYCLTKDMSTITEILYYKKSSMFSDPIEVRQVSGYTIPGSSYKVGDRVIITDALECYSTYSSVFKEMGFKNTKFNDSFSMMNLKIATIFDIGRHPAFSNTILYGIRFYDGSELLISQKGISLFSGFQKDDIVVIESSDKFYDTVPRHLKGQPVRVRPNIIYHIRNIDSISQDIMSSVTDDMGWQNSYFHFRYASKSEKDYFHRNTRKQIINIGSDLSKTVKICNKIIKVDNNIIQLKDIESLIAKLKSIQKMGTKYGWPIDIPTINIGCTVGVTLAQLESIVQAAEIS
jgi:hypothetical protein